MDRSSRTPRFAAHYRPAPPVVWLQTLVLLGGLSVAAVLYYLIFR